MNNKILFVAFEQGFASYYIVKANEVEAFILGTKIINDLLRNPLLLYQYPEEANEIKELLDDGYALEEQCVEIRKLMAEVDENL
jgi:hypothetical protein